MNIATVAAQGAGTEAAADVLAGRLTPEEAGDLWLLWADNRGHDAGAAFLAAYDAAGGPR